MSKQLCKEAIEARRAYQRKWRKEHPDNVKAIQERYWLKKGREMQKAEREARESL